MITSEKMRLYADESASFLAPLPPIYQFVASNPRAGLLHMNEKKAMRVFRALVAPEGLVTDEYQCPTLTDILDARQRHFKVLPRLNSKVIKYCGAYCDKTQAQWSMEREGGLLNTWRDLVQSDLSLARKWKDFLANVLPVDPSEALAYLLYALGVDEDNVVRYLRRHLFQMPGWSSHQVWRQSQGKDRAVSKYLVMRLFYELVLTEKAVASLPGSSSSKPWAQLYAALARKEIAESDDGSRASKQERLQNEAELAFRDDLIGKLSRAREGHGNVVRPSWQMINCIDAREERLRRAFEQVGGGRNQSFGIAGFFGVPARFVETGSHMELALCPIIMVPERRVREVSDSTSFTSRQALKAFAIMMQKRLKGNPSSAFGFVDIVGLPYAFVLYARAFVPGMIHKLFKRKQGCVEQSHTHLDLSEYALPEKISMAAGMLRSIGLTDNFAPAVLLCGHESDSSNNPYAASLQCGACGGNTGRYSARILADILNEKDVRGGLRCEGIDVPEDTHFVAAVHNTTTDDVTLLGQPLPSSHTDLLEQLKGDLCKAGARVRKERLPLLPKGLLDKLNDPDMRARDPANVVPERGLYDGDAIIVGERSWTEGVDLAGRTFLHSYKWRDDPTGELLAGILGGAVVVASGIKEQYRTSVLDNEIFGSGNKVTLNPYGGIGVMQGAFGDLKWGLTEQSVFVQNGIAQDVPMRLLVLIEAPTQLVDKVVPTNETVANLVKNDWIRLVVHDPVSRQFFEASGLGSWKEIRLAA